jgi:hypothetical protein
MDSCSALYCGPLKSLADPAAEAWQRLEHVVRVRNFERRGERGGGKEWRGGREGKDHRLSRRDWRVIYMHSILKCPCGRLG